MHSHCMNVFTLLNTKRTWAGSLIIAMAQQLLWIRPFADPNQDLSESLGISRITFRIWQSNICCNEFRNAPKVLIPTGWGVYLSFFISNKKEPCIAVAGHKTRGFQIFSKQSSCNISFCQNKFSVNFGFCIWNSI